MPTLTLSEQTIARAEQILGSRAHREALTVDAEHVVRAVAEAARSCPECSRDVGHIPECSKHYSRRPTTTDCHGCITGQYGPASNHTCSAWSERRVDV